MKQALIVVLISTVCYAAAQDPILPGESRNLLPESQQTGSQGEVGGTQTTSKALASSTTAIPTETIRLLSMTSVQQKLDLTREELASLSQASRNLQAATTSEEDAFSAVARILNTVQTSQLRTLMIQDLGYGSLALSSVRADLSLSDEQSTQILALVAALEASKRAILSLAVDTASAIKAVSSVASATDLSLSKVLTSAQDGQLHKLAMETAASKP